MIITVFSQNKEDIPSLKSIYRALSPLIDVAFISAGECIIPGDELRLILIGVLECVPQASNNLISLTVDKDHGCVLLIVSHPVKQVISCGMSPKDTVTLSSVGEHPMLSIGREFKTILGQTVEAQELIIPADGLPVRACPRRRRNCAAGRISEQVDPKYYCPLKAAFKGQRTSYLVYFPP